MTISERPTAAIRRVDMSASRPGASAARPSPEDALFHGYRRAGETDGANLDRRTCVCGGIVTADLDRPGPGVAAHNFSARHRAWRLNRGDEDPAAWA